ncbi:MAG: HU family DNA-binding protein [Bryobacteraceae bacterium]
MKTPLRHRAFAPGRRQGRDSQIWQFPHTRRRWARKGRNPKAGASANVPPKTVPYFTPSRELKDALKKLASDQPSDAG